MKILSDAYEAGVPDSFVMAHAIKDTIQHFGADTSRRAGGTVYAPGGKECAIGRFCDTDAMRGDGVSPGKGAEFFTGEGAHYLHPRLRGLPTRFYSGLISLHDRSGNWGHSTGLTSVGKRAARDLVDALGIGGAANVTGLTELIQ